MPKNTFIVAGIMTVLGLGVGYGFGTHQQTAFPTPAEYSQSPAADHSMMNDDSAMPAMMASMTAALQGKTGETFDQAFLQEMIPHHEGAVAMAELALTNAKHQEIKDLAAAIVAAQNEEIIKMRTWQKTWFGMKQ